MKKEACGKYIREQVVILDVVRRKKAKGVIKQLDYVFYFCNMDKGHGGKCDSGIQRT